MSLTPLEHDYMGLSETSSKERSSDKISSSSSYFSAEAGKENVLNLKETELRLGLPGSESPERKEGFSMSLFGKNVDEKSDGFSLCPSKSFVSGAKRGFSDALNGSGKWDFSGNGRSEVGLGKDDVLFTSKENNNGAKNMNTLESCLPGPAMKESGAPPTKLAEEKKTSPGNEHATAPASKAQVVGWPPVRSFRKNTLATNLSRNNEIEGKSGAACLFIKVSMEGAPYLRKVDLKTFGNYAELSSALEKMFSCFTIGQCATDGLPQREGLTESHLMDLLHGSEYVLTYEDKDGDWMLVGDVPWEMFMDSCKRLRIMKGSEAIGLAPRTVQKCRSQNQ